MTYSRGSGSELDRRLLRRIYKTVRTTWERCMVLRLLEVLRGRVMCSGGMSAITQGERNTYRRSRASPSGRSRIRSSRIPRMVMSRIHRLPLAYFRFLEDQKAIEKRQARNVRSLRILFAPLRPANHGLALLVVHVFSAFQVLLCL